MVYRLSKIEELLEEAKKNAIIHPDPLGNDDLIEINFNANNIEYLIEKVKKYEVFIKDCSLAGEGGLLQLRKEAEKILEG